jgi:exosortase
MTRIELSEPVTWDKNKMIATALLLLSFFWLYHSVIAKLVSDWATDDNYSHGFFIMPVALYFAWERRGLISNTRAQRNLLGLVLVFASLAVLLAGILGSELFLTRISILGILAGTVLYVFGWHHLRILIFPILFLLLMIPIPTIVLNQIAFPLQLVASRFSEFALRMFNIPVLREGNVIQLANMSLEVVEACSGIRSLISMLTLGIVYGYFADSRIWVRTLLALATIPIAIVANGIRVAATGVAAHYYGSIVAQGFLHTFSGWLIFLLAFVILFAIHRFIRWLTPISANNI